MVTFLSAIRRLAIPRSIDERGEACGDVRTPPKIVLTIIGKLIVRPGR